VATARKAQRSYRSAARTAPRVTRALKRLGTRIRELRHAKGLTQEQTAEAASLDGKHFQAIEGGQSNVTMASLVGIAHALGVKLAALFEGK
jgi:transcriptional regulator with XRE-family HTH domain